MPSQDSKENLLEHSRAKVRLLQTYLVNYLSVMTNTRFINRLRIYDLFCGRGVYADNGEGSPIAILRTVKNAYFSRKAAKKESPSIDCYFSDKNQEHVSNVSQAISDLNLHYPEVGNLSCVKAEYKSKVQELLSERPRPNGEKTFIFIDPYGYKDINALEIKKLLEKRTEVLLFLPIQFMWRFEAHGTPDALKDFISGMIQFERWQPTENSGKFVKQLRDTFREYLGNDTFVSTFLIEKDPSTVFSLFFFTTHLRGHEQMVDAKWKMDRDAGLGWSFRTVPGQENLIDGLETFYFEHELLEFLKLGNKTNCDIYDFTVIDREFRATHATQACKKFLKEGKLKVHQICAEPIQGNAVYVNYDDFFNKRPKIRFEVISDGSDKN